MKPKKPKARVMWADHDPEYPAATAFQVYPKADDSCRTHDLEQFPVACLPCATKKQAQQIVKFANMTEEERVDEMKDAIANIDANDRASYEEMAEAIHNLIFGGTEK